jgi:cytochrome b6-f complex iron-sulfur subunit
MTDQEPKLERRSFITLLNRLLALGGAAAVLGPIIAYFWPAKLEEVPSEPVPVGEAGSLETGGSRTIRFGRYPAIVINHPASGLVAYSAVCTHFACLVKYNPESGMLECPCHEGFFDPRDGSVISGPPPAPLEPIRVFMQDGTLFIGGEA